MCKIIFGFNVSELKLISAQRDDCKRETWHRGTISQGWTSVVRSRDFSARLSKKYDILLMSTLP